MTVAHPCAELIMSSSLWVRLSPTIQNLQLCSPHSWEKALGPYIGLYILLLFSPRPGDRNS